MIYLIYLYKKDLTLNNLQWLICHKTKPNEQVAKKSQFLNFELEFRVFLLDQLLFPITA